MSSLIGASQTIELLERIKSTVQSFAAREEKLNKDFRSQSTTHQQRRDKAIEELESQLSARIAEADNLFTQAKKAIERRFHQRSTRITQAHKASKAKLHQSIEDREGRRKHKLQMETMQMHRTRKNDTAAAEATFSEFQQKLAAEQQALSALEQSASKAFGGFGKFRRFLSAKHEGVDEKRHENDLLTEMEALVPRAEHDIKAFGRRLLPLLFRYKIFWTTLALCVIPVAVVLPRFGISGFEIPHAIASTAGLLIIGGILHFLTQRSSEPAARKIAGDIVKARQLHILCGEKAEASYNTELQRIEQEFQSKAQWIEQEWNLAIDTASNSRQTAPATIDQKAERASARNEKSFHEQLATLEKAHQEQLDRLKNDTESQRASLLKDCAEKESTLRTAFNGQWETLQADWKSAVGPLWTAISTNAAAAEKDFPPWSVDNVANWDFPEKFGGAIKFGRINVDLGGYCEAVPQDPRLAWPGDSKFWLPLSVTYPNQGSILFETKGARREEIIGALNNLILRLLSSAPPGRLSFTIVDPVGLGQSFAGLMHLADLAEHVINDRIWTQANQIEQKLADLNEHMEKVIQMYLRNEYATIAEYNEQAGNIAEKYHFLVIADFPSNFTDLAAKRLLSIAASGARCGVYTLIHWDHCHAVPADFITEEFRKSSISITTKGEQFTLFGKAAPGTDLLLDAPPSPEVATQLVQTIGLVSRDSNRIEVPFAQVTPKDSELWTLETTHELRVPIGRTGATKLQHLAIGKGTRQHALLAGKTGSGKSTLFHVLITNLALWCSPDEVEFYLIDFKKGVEFKCYATHGLPHARVIAIESDREFGLSVLNRVDEELRRRGDLFRTLGVQDIAGYKKAGGTEPMPRSLLIIDEFQEFFVEDDKISQSASVLLDRIVRQGRAFGIHVLLGSQTLGGAYTMARTTIGQMVIRIALQCNEADAYLIMDDNNPAPRLLSRPGEGIYNDTAGTIEGNSPFQTVWLSDEVRDMYLEKINAHAAKHQATRTEPVVFEGNAPAEVRENRILSALLNQRPAAPVPVAHLWLGTPNSIKGPTEAVFKRQSGSNLLIVGQRDEAILAMVSIGLISLAAQYPADLARFILFDGNPADSPQRDFLKRIVQTLPHEVLIAKNNDPGEFTKQLIAEKNRRSEEGHEIAPSTFVFVHGIQKFGKFRYEEDFSFSADDSEANANPASQLNKLICEGASLGIHVITTCDTYNNVNRFLSKKALTEFESRVLFQMSANDSASLIDSPKAGNLGLHRALFYNEQEGHLEVFRPYALPNREWIDDAARKLARQ